MGEEVSTEQAIAKVIALLEYYSFDLNGKTAPWIIQTWQEQYSLPWIRMAILEALYRGRYKTVSVEEILRRWQTKGKPFFNFDADFEALICTKVENQQISSPISTAPSQITEVISSEINTDIKIKDIQPKTSSTETLGRNTYQKLKAIAQDKEYVDAEESESSQDLK